MWPIFKCLCCRGLPAKPKASTATPAAQSTVVRKAARALGMGKDPQRFYPQCRACSNKQASAVKHNRMTLRMHFSGVQPWHFAGASHWGLGL